MRLRPEGRQCYADGDMIGRLASLVLIGASGLVAGQHTGSGLQLTDVFVAGDNGYHTFRIPSVIATRSGALVAFAEARLGSAADAGDIDLVLRRSTDGGATWSPLKLIGDNGPNTFGNPCPVMDRATGAIFLFSTQNAGTDLEKDIIAGTSTGSRTVWVMKSTDEGVTWSVPAEITTAVKASEWTWYATGPGVGIQTRAGSFVIPANHAESGGVHRSHLILSDDGGRSWKLGASADAGTNESQVVELEDGRLMLNMRNHPPRPENFRMVATSEDGGRTLSKAAADPALVEPPAQASLLRLTTGRTHDRNRLLFANPAGARRERLTVRLSYDEGATWPVSRVVHDGPAAYSSLVVLPDLSAAGPRAEADHTIGLLFERGVSSPYERITFAHFTLDWLTDGKDRPSSIKVPR